MIIKLICCTPANSDCLWIDWKYICKTNNKKVSFVLDLRTQIERKCVNTTTTFKQEKLRKVLKSSLQASQINTIILMSNYFSCLFAVTWMTHSSVQSKDPKIWISAKKLIIIVVNMYVLSPTFLLLCLALPPSLCSALDAFPKIWPDVIFDAPMSCDYSVYLKKNHFYYNHHNSYHSMIGTHYNNFIYKLC